MKYMLLIYGNEQSEQTAGKEADGQMMAAHMAYGEAMRKAGVMVGGERLQGTKAATTVRAVNGQPKVLDGPYAETKEQLGGFYMIDVPDLDSALSWASRCPSASRGVIEVAVSAGEARHIAEALARQSYGKLVAFLASRTHDVAAAEDALCDAFAAALVDWPASGVPQSPEAWLITVARRRMTDATRRRRIRSDALEHLRLVAEELEAMNATHVPDSRLALMFACAHPAIDAGIRAPLILQTILGFDAAAIASAFLVSPATMGQRLVRAKTKIRQARIPFRLPEPDEFAERLDAVLAAVYAAFAEGWTDPLGTETRRRNLAEEAIWLGRLIASLLPDEPEALGLLALMLYAEARRPARRGPAGEYVPLATQDPRLWDARLIEEAETLLRQASAVGATGRYQLEAAVQSAHVVRRLTGRADWTAIVAIYDALLELTGSPVVAINRAVAIAETHGPAAGLLALDVLAGDARLGDYQPYWAARAGLLAANGDAVAADQAYERAIGLEPDAAVRAFLQRQRAEIAAPASQR